MSSKVNSIGSPGYKSGGLINIAAYGGQDIFLTNNPEITYFRTIYRTHTHFSIESKEIGFNNIVGFDKESTIIFPRIGDLISNMYLQIKLPEIKFPRIELNDIKNKTLLNNISKKRKY